MSTDSIDMFLGVMKTIIFGPDHTDINQVSAEDDRTYYLQCGVILFRIIRERNGFVGITKRITPSEGVPFTQWNLYAKFDIDKFVILVDELEKEST